MRNSRFVIALAAVACAAALPAVAAAHKPAHHGHPGKGQQRERHRCPPCSGCRSDGQGRRRAQAARGRAEHRRARPRASPPARSTRPTCIPARAWRRAPRPCRSPTSTPMSAASPRSSRRCRPTPPPTSWPTASTSPCTPAMPRTPVISCGDRQRQAARRPDKSAAFTFLKGAGSRAWPRRALPEGQRRDRLDQPQRPDPGAHAVHLHAGTCAAPRRCRRQPRRRHRRPRRQGQHEDRLDLDHPGRRPRATRSTCTPLPAPRAPAPVVACGDLYGFGRHTATSTSNSGGER